MLTKLLRYEVQQRAHQISVRIEQRAAASRENVLANDILQKRRLAGASLADNRDMASAVALADAERPHVPSGVRASEICECIVFVGRFHPYTVASGYPTITEGRCCAVGKALNP